MYSIECSDAIQFIFAFVGEVMSGAYNQPILDNKTLQFNEYNADEMDDDNKGTATTTTVPKCPINHNQPKSLSNTNTKTKGSGGHSAQYSNAGIQLPLSFASVVNVFEKENDNNYDLTFDTIRGHIPTDSNWTLPKPNSVLHATQMSFGSGQFNIPPVTSLQAGVISCNCNANLRLFCKLFPYQNEQHKLKLVQHFVEVENDAKLSDKSESLKIVLQNSAAVILGCCKCMLGKVRDSVLRIASDFLAFNNPLVMRPGAQVFGILSKMEDNAFKKFGEDKPNIRAASALALGCIHQYSGSKENLGFTVAALQLLERDGNVSLWLLHSLQRILHVLNPSKRRRK